MFLEHYPNVVREHIALNVVREHFALPNRIPLLTLAASWRNHEALALFLQYGADVDATHGDRNNQAHTALIQAVLHGDAHAVWLLCEADATMDDRLLLDAVCVPAVNGGGNLRLIRTLCAYGAERIRGGLAGTKVAFSDPQGLL